MRAHVLENNVVVNTIEVESLNVLPNLINGDVGGIGWIYDGSELHNPNAPSDEELTAMKSSSIRSERNLLLTQSDWTQVADAPVDKQAWATYRQALRDISLQAGFPTLVNWPIKPE